MRLLRTDITERGTIYAGIKGPVLFTKGFRWIDPQGDQHITSHFEISIPGEGTLKYLGIGSVFNFLWCRFGEEATIELSEDFKRRLKHQMSLGISTAEDPEAHPNTEDFTPEWTDYQFSNPNRYKVSESLEETVQTLSGIKGTGRGPAKATEKLAQAKYRQKDSSKDDAKKRRRVSLDTNIEMRKAQKWMKTNPGKTFEDYMLITNPVEEDSS